MLNEKTWGLVSNRYTIALVGIFYLLNQIFSTSKDIINGPHIILIHGWIVNMVREGHLKGALIKWRLTCAWWLFPNTSLRFLSLWTIRCLHICFRNQLQCDQWGSFSVKYLEADCLKKKKERKKHVSVQHGKKISFLV